MGASAWNVVRLGLSLLHKAAAAAFILGLLLFAIAAGALLLLWIGSFAWYVRVLRGARDAVAMMSR